MSEGTLHSSWQEKFTQAKLKVKEWEGEYKAANSCCPDKAALAMAPEDIQTAYKTYCCYRKALDRIHNATREHKRAKSENVYASSFECKSTDINVIDNSKNQVISCVTLRDKESSESLSNSKRVPFDHNVDDLVMTKTSTGSMAVSLQNPSGPSILPEVIKSTFITPPFTSKNSVWGKHLNKSTDQTEMKVISKHKSLYTEMAEKLRANGTIRVRTSLKKSSALDKQQSGSFCTQENIVKHSFGSETNTQTDKENCSSVLIDSEPNIHNDYSFTCQEPVVLKKNLTQNHVTRFDTSTIENEKTLESINVEAKSVSFDAVENEPSKYTLRVKRIQDIKKPHTQAVSAISLITKKDSQSGVLAIKKKTVLNHGWVVRCTEADLGQETGGKDMLVPPNDWKIRPADKDWVENEEEGVISEILPLEASACSTNTMDSKPQTKVCTTSSNTCDSGGKKGITKMSSFELTFHKENLYGNSGLDHEGEYLHNFCKAISSKKMLSNAKTKSKAKRTLKNKNLVINHVDTIMSDSQSIVGDDPYDLDREISKQESRNDKILEKNRKRGLRNGKTLETESLDETNFSRGKHENLEMEVQTEEEMKDITVRKNKKVESVEELEESGKIQSVWPPPKKKRVARKKTKSFAAVGRKHKGIDPGKAAEESKGLDKELKCKKEDRSGHLSHNQDYDEIQDIESHGMKNTNQRDCMSTREHFIKKVTLGATNGNYVRINLKKKTFVRGRKSMTAGKYKRQEWKKKQIMKSAEEGNAGAIKTLTCFKCGDFGHWAKNCSGKKGDNLMPLEDYYEKESTFLSLEEAASLARGIKPSSVFPVSKMFHEVEELQERKSKGEDNEKESSFIDLSHETNQQLLKCSKLCQNENFNNEQKCYIDAESEEVHLKSTDSNELSEDGKEYSHMDLDDDIFANMKEKDVTDEFHSQASELTVRQCSGTSAQSQSLSVNDPKYSRQTVEPLYPLENGKVVSTPVEVYDALHMFGYSAFRPGQENSIMRILSGQSTLLVLSTGSGKSLCYQLPAYLYAKYNHCITVCVSPLVSLMEDQVTGLPNFLRAVCLHTHQNSTQRLLAVNAIRSGSAHILLVSPEAVVASRTGGVLGTLLKELPPVAFACLDEVHCVSEWSHNFRPSYLRVCQVLRERLGVQTILGLTATARQATALSIAQHLLIPNFDTGIIRGASIPKNLYLSVSCDQNREWALVSLLQGERFSKCSSIIIYCTRREECERIATLIRTQLLDPSKVDVKGNLKRTRGISFDAEAYHAGLSSHRRQQVQKRFMAGKLRIVVATVAFGMGIDKADVHGIIHFNMPRNVESYVQEIGRAGRDGEDAQCHLFLDVNVGRDIQELKRHIYANSLDRHTVRKLLNRVFKPCACAKVKNLETFKGNENRVKNGAPVSPKASSCEPSFVSSQIPGATEMTENSETTRTEPTSCAVESFTVSLSPSSCPRHEIAIPIDRIVEELDLPEENLETLLCYLELHHRNLIHLNSHVYANCTVSCYGGPKQLLAVSRQCPPLAVAIALEHHKGVSFEKRNTVSFPVVEVASRMGWNSKIVKRELKALEWNSQGLSRGERIKRSGVTVEFTDLSFHMEARGDLSDDELDQLLDALFKRTQTQEQNQLRQLYYIYHLAHTLSHNSIILCCDSVDMDRCTKLREELGKYFSREGKNMSEVQLEEKLYIKPEVEASIRSSIRALLSTHTDQQWTGRAVARVLHGIGSPNFPTKVWGRVRRFWRQYLNTDFNLLVSLATQEIIRCK